MGRRIGENSRRIPCFYVGDKILGIMRMPSTKIRMHVRNQFWGGVDDGRYIIFCEKVYKEG